METSQVPSGSQTWKGEVTSQMHRGRVGLGWEMANEDRDEVSSFNLKL